jgi:hypothetical protein
MTIRGHIDKFLNDSLEVNIYTMNVLKLLALPFYLDNKDIFNSFYAMFDALKRGCSESTHEIICKEYYEVLIALKEHLNSLTEENIQHRPGITEGMIVDFK